MASLLEKSTRMKSSILVQLRTKTKVTKKVPLEEFEFLIFKLMMKSLILNFFLLLKKERSQEDSLG